MRSHVPLLLLGLAHGSLSHQPAQNVLSSPGGSHASGPVSALSEDAIRAALVKHADPVDALIYLQPHLASELSQPRLIHVRGEKEAKWLTEGDKMRLRRKGRKFVDITDNADYYTDVDSLLAGDPHLPEFRHQRLIKPLLSHVSTDRMRAAIEHFSGFYNRYYGDVIGAHSASWLHDQIAAVIQEAPFGTHISLEYFTHSFPQSSIVARFEPKVRNASAPLTILGAHQDSANYLFPLLAAPGADDDGSGTVSILEAFRVLAHAGYTPLGGPVEFHWYAAEEGGLLGSQAVARFKKEQNAKVGAMMEFDMTAFVAANATESIGFVKTQSDEKLTDWAVKLSTEYVAIPAHVYDLGEGAGSDYMSWTQLKYPATFATEGNPVAGGSGGYGEFDPYIHSSKDTMYVNDSTGVYSIDHMARFSELAIAFVVEQAGWDNKWR
ncbi:peptidase [Microdochium bolleyi]|uniref:Peptide hydrolase n=1 Tax=Microdochium bolleyi TaxID=196109 RepID=A0A136IZK8_9PEZI|nr:peptidase [Microdochium bolleyi]